MAKSGRPRRSIELYQHHVTPGPGERKEETGEESPFVLGGGEKVDEGSEERMSLQSLKVRRGPDDLIHGVSPVGSQYGNFCPIPRDFPRNPKETGDATMAKRGVLAL